MKLLALPLVASMAILLAIVRGDQAIPSTRNVSYDTFAQSLYLLQENLAFPVTLRLPLDDSIDDGLVGPASRPLPPDTICFSTGTIASTNNLGELSTDEGSFTDSRASDSDPGEIRNPLYRPSYGVPPITYDSSSSNSDESNTDSLSSGLNIFGVDSYFNAPFKVSDSDIGLKPYVVLQGHAGWGATWWSCRDTCVMQIAPTVQANDVVEGSTFPCLSFSWSNESSGHLPGPTCSLYNATLSDMNFQSIQVTRVSNTSDGPHTNTPDFNSTELFSDAACYYPWTSVCPQDIPQMICNGNCTEIRSDTQNCGTCGNVCSSPQVCTNGQCLCVKPDLLADQPPCAGDCNMTFNKRTHCGSCDNSCIGEEDCISGSDGQWSCGCPQQTLLSGFRACRGACNIDMFNDNLNCGACGHVCPDGQSCKDGACHSAMLCKIDNDCAPTYYGADCSCVERNASYAGPDGKSLNCAQTNFQASSNCTTDLDCANVYDISVPGRATGEPVSPYVPVAGLTIATWKTAGQDSICVNQADRSVCLPRATCTNSTYPVNLPDVFSQNMTTWPPGTPCDTLNLETEAELRTAHNGTNCTYPRLLTPPRDSICAIHGSVKQPCQLPRSMGTFGLTANPVYPMDEGACQRACLSNVACKSFGVTPGSCALYDRSVADMQFIPAEQQDLESPVLFDVACFDQECHCTAPATLQSYQPAEYTLCSETELTPEDWRNLTEFDIRTQHSPFVSIDPWEGKCPIGGCG